MEKDVSLLLGKCDLLLPYMVAYGMVCWKLVLKDLATSDLLF